MLLQVGIALRGLNMRMAQQVLHLVQRPTTVNENGGKGVAQVMHAHIPQVSLLSRPKILHYPLNVQIIMYIHAVGRLFTKEGGATPVGPGHCQFYREVGMPFAANQAVIIRFCQFSLSPVFAFP